MDKETFLQKALLTNGYHFSAATIAHFLAYLELLRKWNKTYNLTAIQRFEDSVMLHVLDSLSIRDYLHGQRIVDIGSGAGLPGIPLALACPDKTFVLLDCNGKKTRFLSQVVYELQLSNIEIVHSRCEAFQAEKRFDSIISRAFASLPVMLEATQHLRAPDGQFLAMKGVYPETEIQAIAPPFKLLAAHKLVMKGMDAQRHLICVTKL